MRRVRAADDFEAIRVRLEELRRQRRQADDDSNNAEQKPGRDGERTSLAYGGRRLPISHRASSR
jgi:hypothetical protein